MLNNIETSAQSKIGKFVAQAANFCSTKLGIALLYVLTYLLLFIPISKGIGQYWDWNFPYFKDQVPNMFWNYAFSWLGADTGGPMSYMSDYYVRLFFYVSSFLSLQPEIFRYIFISICFAASSYGTYLVVVSIKPDIQKAVAYIAGLAAFINPLMFYKLMAGHIDYLVSITVFVYLVYFVTQRFDSTKRRHSIILGLFLAFVGAQIQFFVFAVLFLFIYFAAHKEKRTIRGMLLAFSICFLINLPWLSNFIVGGIDISSVSALAAKASFAGLSFGRYEDILTMKFSKATLIDKYYDPHVLLSFSLLYVLLFLMVLLRRGSNIKEQHSFFVLHIFVLVGFQVALVVFSDLSFVQLILPMFREFGHIGPIVVFSLVVAIITWPVEVRERLLISGLFLVFVLANVPVFLYELPTLNFSVIRSHLAEFKKDIDSDDSTYRVMSFPFFTPYSFKFVPKSTAGGFALYNAGHDSFMSFAGKSRLSNLIPGYSFLNSPQSLLVQSLNLDIIRPYNIKYVFDLSGVYKSEYKRYLPEELYKGREQLFDQDSSFISRLSDSNPGLLEKISDNVYSIKNASGRAFTFNDLWCIKSPEWNSVFELQRLFGVYGYATRSNCDPSKQASIVNFQELTKRRYIDPTTSSLKYPVKEVFGSQKVSLYSSSGAIGYFAKIEKGKLTVTSRSQGSIKSQGKNIASVRNDTEVLETVPVRENRHYYIKVGEQILSIPEDKEVYLGSRADAAFLEIYKEGLNIYNPKKQNLTLLGNFKPYVISYDYKGKKGESMGYTISLQSSTGTTSSITDSYILDEDEWKSYKKMFVLPESQDDAVVDAALQFNTKDPVAYQNVQISRLDLLKTVQGPNESGYQKQDLPELETAPNFSYDHFGYTFTNIINNGSFEKGLWQKDPIICHKDNLSANTASISLNKSRKTDGGQSVELKSKDNVTCIKTTVKLNPGATYVLSFDYEGQNADSASYRIDYQNPSKSQHRDSKDITQATWDTYEKNITVPQDASSATIYFFSRAGKNGFETTHRYDKISMIELPPLNRSVYLVGDLQNKYREPSNVWYKDMNPAKSEITVAGATDPFYLGFSETFNRDWKVRPRFTKGGISANPFNFTGVVPEKDHFRVNEYFNAWRIDPLQYCVDQSQTCVKEQDGSYTINLTVEFWPQRWFVIFLSISFFTLVFSVVSLLHAYHFDHVNYLDLLFRRRK